MSFLKTLFGGGDIIKTVGNVVDEFVTTDEERLELEAEIAKTKMNYNLEMQKLSVKERELMVQDVSSARTMQAQVQSSEHASTLSKNIVPMMAIVTTVLTFALFFWLLKDDGTTLTGGKKDVVLYILGALSAITTQIFSFYFGSSQGSSDKNKIMEKMRSGKG